MESNPDQPASEWNPPEPSSSIRILIPISQRRRRLTGSSSLVGGSPFSNRSTSVRSSSVVGSWLERHSRSMDLSRSLQLSSSRSVSHHHPSPSSADTDQDFVVSPLRQQTSPLSSTQTLRRRSSAIPRRASSLLSNASLLPHLDRPIGYFSFMSSTSSSSPTNSEHVNAHGNGNFQRQQQEDESSGKSSVVQTVVNAVHLFIGVGLLSMPYALREVGYVLGPVLILVCAGLSYQCSRKLLACMQTDSDLHSYADVAERVLGRTGQRCMSLLYLVELFACAVTYIVVIGDTLMVLYPDGISFSLPLSLGHGELSRIRLEKFGIQLVTFVFILLPSSLLRRLDALSAASLLGLLASLLLTVVMGWQAASTPHSPGSLFEPGPGLQPWPLWGDDVDPTNDRTVPDVFSLRTLFVLVLSPALQQWGVFLYNYSAAAVLPHLYRDMKRPERFPQALKWTWALITGWLIFVALLGYWMYGKETRPLIIDNLTMSGLTAHAWIHRCLLWMTVLNPMTKFSLLLHPVSHHLDEHLLQPFLARRQTDAETEPLLLQPPTVSIGSGIYGTLLRACVSSLAFMVAVAWPDVHRWLSGIGLFLASLVSILFPCWAYHCLCNASTGSWDRRLNQAVMLGTLLVLGLGLVDRLK